MSNLKPPARFLRPEIVAKGEAILAEVGGDRAAALALTDALFARARAVRSRMQRTGEIGPIWVHAQFIGSEICVEVRRHDSATHSPWPERKGVETVVAFEPRDLQ